MVADADPTAGRGHLSRCSAIAAALAELAVPTRFLALGAEPVSSEQLRETVEGSVLVLDTYDAARRDAALAAGRRASPSCSTRASLLPAPTS